MKVFKAGRRLPSGNGISSLLTTYEWSINYYQHEWTVAHKQLCARPAPFFVCETLESAIAVGSLPPGSYTEGMVVEVWEAETPAVYPSPSWVPHPDRSTPEWFLFWQSLINHDGTFISPLPDPPETYYHRCPVPEGTLLCFELRLVERLREVPSCAME